MADRKTGTYGWTSIVLHWLGAAALIASFLTGEALEDVSGGARASAYATHVTWGVILAVPLLARVIWRSIEGFKRTSTQHWAFEWAARVVMIGLLISIAGAVLSGLFLPWTAGQPLEIGGLSLASPFGRMGGVHELLEEAHELFSHLWLPLILLHILGALKHLIINRDGVFAGIFWPLRKV